MIERDHASLHPPSRDDPVPGQPAHGQPAPGDPVRDDTGLEEIDRLWLVDDQEAAVWSLVRTTGCTPAQVRHLRTVGNLRKLMADLGVTADGTGGKPLLAAVDIDLGSPVDEDGHRVRAEHSFAAMTLLTDARIPFVVFTSENETSSNRRLAMLMACRLFEPLAVLSKDPPAQIMLDGEFTDRLKALQRTVLVRQPLNDRLTSLYRPPQDVRDCLVDRLFSSETKYLVMREQARTRAGTADLARAVQKGPTTVRKCNSEAIELLESHPVAKALLNFILPPPTGEKEQSNTAMIAFAVEHALAIDVDDNAVYDALKAALWDRPARRRTGSGGGTRRPRIGHLPRRGRP